MQIVEIKWVDTMSTSGWQKKGEKYPAKDMVQYSVGYLKEKSKKQVIICQSSGVFNDGEILQIPKECVKSIRRIRR